ncbi:hypothetical protein [Streptomyces sp. NK15101]|uniref:hypothetical protein n=1 Tax=Streptomyces sp. NK15101 TaxID=2873261 RepID=UPI001CED215F|nr:hypothetical protein [Streptomyces sp. NK15101]
MLSPQILTKGTDTAALEADRLVVTTAATRKEIPLAVVQEVRRDSETSLTIVLTDGVTHSVTGGNPTATALFHTALDAALPEERDPAGSSLVTVEDDPGAVPWPKVFAWGAAFVAAYAGYVWWTAVAHGGAMAVIAFFAAFGTLVGLLGVFGVVSNLRDRWILRRRGVTVRAAADHYPNGKRSHYYKFTDTHGNEYLQRASSNSTPYIHVVYDPQGPGRRVQGKWLPILISQYVFGSLAALGVLALGLWGVLAPYV